MVSTSADDVPTGSVLLAVNGTLMRGLKYNSHMVAAKATFVREAATEPTYRLWSVGDDHPAMIHVTDGTGRTIHVEVWAVPLEGLAGLLEDEPSGLAIGKVRLDDGDVVLGVLAENALVEGQREITEYGGWRAYVQAEGISS
jgi:carbamate kinase